ncbi:hypothetical protein AAHA92_06844 [Salvia divinorum]|uniref:Uncharacterized protein n=1 Tax=Salvia divinorum TaxID=28513 RepID=A0ABD1I829_SALDI
MVETHLEGGGEGDVGTSYEKSEGDLLSMMTQLMTDLKKDVNRIQSDVNGIRSDARESEIRMQATHNTLFEELNTLKKDRPSRPPTPRKDPIPNFIPKEYSGDEGYDGGYARNRGVNWENGRSGMENGVHSRFGNENAINGDGRYRDYKSFGGYSREIYGGGDYESRYYGGGLERGDRRERVTRIQEESRLRWNEEYERLKGYERSIERDALCRVWIESSFRHGDCDNTQSRITPWKTDTSHPVASPKSSFESLMEQSQRVVPSRNEKHHGLKYEYFGDEAK